MRAQRYFLAVGTWLVAVLVRQVLDATFHSNPFFTPFYPAVMVSAWLGGFGPGLMAVALSTPSAWYLWALNAAPNPNQWLNVAGATTTMTVVVVVTDSLRRQRHRAEAAHRAAEQYSAELATRAREREDFLALLAHELRNPLNPLRNVQKLLEPNMSNERVEFLRGLIGRQVGQVAHLLDDLLEGSRTLHSGLTFVPQRVALDEVLGEALASVHSQVESGELSIDERTDSDSSLSVYGDRSRLVQAFSSLLDNAAKFSSPGGTIEVHQGVVGSDVVIAIKDHGPGISPELAPRVFEAFVQGDSTLSRTQGGLGLGLFLVRQIVEGHGGTVEASSSDLGSTLSVTLPLFSPERRAGDFSEAEDVEAGEEVGVPRREGRALRVLIVDDQEDSAISLAMLLESLGFAPRVEYNAAAAIEAFETFLPRVVITDIGLPDVDGYELARRIRDRNADENLLLVALTGYGHADARERSRQSGFDAHLVKPVDSDKLQRLLEKAVRNGGSSRESSAEL